MNWWKRFKSRVSGKVPTVNDLDLDSIGINSADGKVFIKKRTEAGVESIVEIGGSGGSGGGATTFLELTDTPASYSGQAGKVPVVNSGENALEFQSLPSGGSGITSVTYSELIALISASGLTPGAQYLITDFATKHYFINYNEDTSLFAPITSAINTGTTEPLIVTATAVNKLSIEAKSTIYPKDRIYYDWDANNWLNDISFASGGVIVTGWKGVIYYRHDTVKNNELQYDFRAVKFRRWKLNMAAWSSSTTYAVGATVMHGGFAYYSLRGSNLNNTPGSSPSQWAAFNEDYYSGSPYDYLCVASSIYGNYSVFYGDDSDYQDFFTFENYNNVFEYHAINNQPMIYQFGSYTPIGIGSILTGVVWFMPFDTSVLYNVHITGWYEMCSIITESIRDVNVKDFKWNIGTLATVQNVSCKESLSYNQFMGGQISMLNCNSFYGNSLSGSIQCQLGGEINNNVIAGYCSFYSIGRFTSNNLYYNTSFMTFGAGRITSCTLAVNMYNIQGECHSQNFTGATQVSNSNRTNTLQRTGASTNVLIYYSGTTQYIVAANA